MRDRGHELVAAGQAIEELLEDLGYHELAGQMRAVRLTLLEELEELEDDDDQDGDELEED